MQEDNKHWLQYDFEVQSIVRETKTTIAKLERDIEKIKKQGLPQLNLNPPGVDNKDSAQVRKILDSLQNSIEITKVTALDSVDQKLTKYPADIRRNIKEAVESDLSVKQPEKNQEKENKTESPFSSRFLESLSISKYFNDDVNKLDRSIPREKTSEKSKDEK